MTERQYSLASMVPYHGGWVRFDWEKDVQSARPSGADTVVTLRNGKSYLLLGRGYGV